MCKILKIKIKLSIKKNFHSKKKMDYHLNQSVLTQLTNLNTDQSTLLGIDSFSKSKFLELKKF